MLSYQLMLTVKRGLPLSRLLSNQKTDARSTKAELQEESTLPPLKVKEEVVIKEEKQEEVAKPEVREEREEMECPGEGVSTSGSSIFTLRNSQSGANPSTFQPPSIGPAISPFSVPPPPLFTPPTRCSPLPNSTVLPDACCKLGFLWRLSMLGSHHPNLFRPVAHLGSCTMPASTIHDFCSA